MPKFVIERDMPGAGQLSAAELQAASQQSNKVLNETVPRIQWVRSCVTGDKLFRVYIAPDADMVRRRAEMAGFPANQVISVSLVIDPITAEG